MKVSAATCLAALVAVAQPSVAQTAYPASCPVISADQFRALNTTLATKYDTGFFFLERQRGRSTCISHKPNNLNCKISDPGVMHVKIQSGDTYFSVPEHDLADVSLTDGLNCVLR